MKILKWNSPIIIDLLHSPISFKIASLDVGTKYVGVAITDETRRLVVPIKRDIRRKSSVQYNRMSDQSIQSFNHDLNNLISTHNIRLIVVGLPLHMFQLTPLADEIIDLMMKVEIDQVNSAGEAIYCTFWDETDSTVTARALSRSMSNKRSVFTRNKDSLAAYVILESFLRASRITQSVE